jgi:hypothetical protein
MAAAQHEGDACGVVAGINGKAFRRMID